MVALQAVTTAATAIVMDRVGKRIPTFKDARIEAAVIAAVGLGAVLLSIKLKDGMGKAIVVGVGVGLISAGASRAFPVVA